MTISPKDAIGEAQRREQAFLTGIARNLDALPRKLANPFGKWGSLKLHIDRSMSLGWDRSAEIKPAMIAAGCFDRSLQAKMPRSGAKLWTWRRHFWNYPREVAIATVTLAPLADLAAGRRPSPAGPTQLEEIVKDIAARHDGGCVLLCMSPGGWEKDTFDRLPKRRRVKIILIEPWPAGGWRVRFDAIHSPSRESWLQIADPETREQRIQRIREAVEARRADILTGGIEATQLAEQLGVPTGLVAAVFRETAEARGDLQLLVEDQRLTLYHSLVDQNATHGSEEVEMGLFQKLFGREPDERQRIEVLSGKRSVLTSRRDRLFGDIAALEAKEQALLDEGAATENKTTRKRVAAQLGLLRKDIGRMQRLGGLLAQQIDVISSQVGNLQLIVEGQSARLPTEQELVDTAVKADEVIREITETADQVQGLEGAMTSMGTVVDEDEIFAEFDRRAEKLSEEKKVEQKAEVEAEAEVRETTREYEPVHPESENEKLVVDLDEDEQLEEGV